MTDLLDMRTCLDHIATDNKIKKKKKKINKNCISDIQKHVKKICKQLGLIIIIINVVGS